MIVGVRRVDGTDLDRLLDFAARSRLPGGGFGYLGADGRVLADRPMETWIVARMTHVFGLAHLLGRPGADELSRSGVEAGRPRILVGNDAKVVDLLVRLFPRRYPQWLVRLEQRAAGGR